MILQWDMKLMSLKIIQSLLREKAIQTVNSFKNLRLTEKRKEQRRNLRNHKCLQPLISQQSKRIMKMKKDQIITKMAQKIKERMEKLMMHH
jgi:hypothetical protein